MNILERILEWYYTQFIFHGWLGKTICCKWVICRRDFACLLVRMCGHTTFRIYHIYWAQKNWVNREPHAGTNFCMTIPPNLSRYTTPNASKLRIDLCTSSFPQHPTAFVYCVSCQSLMKQRDCPITNPNPLSNPKYLPKWRNGSRTLILLRC